MEEREVSLSVQTLNKRQIQIQQVLQRVVPRGKNLYIVDREHKDKNTWLIDVLCIDPDTHMPKSIVHELSILLGWEIERQKSTNDEGIWYVMQPDEGEDALQETISMAIWGDTTSSITHWMC